MSRVDVPSLLERLGIKARRVANRPRGKFEGPCPHPAHRSNAHAWHIKDEPDGRENGWHSCLSCGFKGGVVTLILTVTGCTAEEAREFLDGEEAARPVPDKIELEVVAPKLKFRLPEAVRFEPWERWPAGARQYLVRKRGFDGSMVEEFGFGFVPEDATQKNEKTGAIEQHRLWGRIVIPFRDRAGRVLSYTARTWNEKNPKRYLEPRRTDNPAPGAIFNEHRWIGAETVVVAEGSFDAAALDLVLDDARFDVGALAGSSLDTTQVQKILKGRKLVVCVTDPDKAGLKAARELRNAVCRSTDFVRVDLPSGKDAADMALEDSDELRRRVLTAAGIM